MNLHFILYLLLSVHLPTGEGQSFPSPKDCAEVFVYYTKINGLKYIESPDKTLSWSTPVYCQ